MDPRTLEFYQSHSLQWAQALLHRYSPHLDPFLDRLDPGARILELGEEGKHRRLYPLLTIFA